MIADVLTGADQGSERQRAARAVQRRQMGRKNVRSDDPAQRNDTKILEVVIALDAPTGLVVDQRVTCYVVG